MQADAIFKSLSMGATFVFLLALKMHFSQVVSESLASLMTKLKSHTLARRYVVSAPTTRTQNPRDCVCLLSGPNESNGVLNSSQSEVYVS